MSRPAVPKANTEALLREGAPAGLLEVNELGKSFGGTSAVTTALLCGIGYIIAISSVLAIVGGYLSIVLNYYFGWNIPWGILSVILTAGSMVMMVRGVSVSTKLAGLFFGHWLERNVHWPPFGHSAPEYVRRNRRQLFLLRP